MACQLYSTWHDQQIATWSVQIAYLHSFIPSQFLPLGPNTFLSTPFSNTLSHCSIFIVTDQLPVYSNSHHTSVYVLVSTVLCRERKDESRYSQLSTSRTYKTDQMRLFQSHFPLHSHTRRCAARLSHLITACCCSGRNLSPCCTYGCPAIKPSISERSINMYLAAKPTSSRGRCGLMLSASPRFDSRTWFTTSAMKFDWNSLLCLPIGDCKN